MIIKLPAFYDVSHWKEVEDFTKVSPRPLLFGTKATEGTNLVDGKFERFFAGMKQIGVRRLCFHFHRKAYSPTTQAQFFVNTIKPHITDLDILALDVEEGGETAAQLKTWCEYVMNALPRNMLWIYSRRNILENIPTFLTALFPKLTDYMNAGKSALDTIQMTLAEREFFKDLPTWIAGYPINPDLYSGIPSFYIPDQTKWGPPYAWQYSPKGKVAGIQGDVDLNWLAPVAVALLNGGTPPTPEPDVNLELFGGQARYEKIALTQPRPIVYHLAQFDAAGAEIIVSSPNTNGRLNKKTILDFMNETGCDLAVNADEPYYYNADEYYLKRRAMSNGLRYGIQTDGATVSLDKNNNVTRFSWNGYAADCWNAVSGSKMLLFEGVPQPVDDSLPPDPRTIWGWDGMKFYWLVIDGRSALSGGMTILQQVIESRTLIQVLGARNAAFLDGGGSSAMAIRLNGVPKVVNLPSDGRLRDVGHYIGIKFKGGTMSNGTAKEILGNIGTIRKEPSRYGMDTGKRVSSFSTIEFVEIVPAVVKGTADNPSDQWFKLLDGNFVNYILAGKSYFQILTQPTPEPTPTLPDLPVKIEIGDDVTYARQVVNITLKPKQ